MWLSGPHNYTISVLNDYYAVSNENGHNKFLSPVTSPGPKLYVFAAENRPVYIGQTFQRMAARMRLGFRAYGPSGYYGYRWRHALPSAQLVVWCLEGVVEQESRRVLECIESEVVFAYRLRYNQWPRYQTEIHFHETSAEHRALAAQVFAYFCGDAPPQTLRQAADAVATSGIPNLV